MIDSVSLNRSPSRLGAAVNHRGTVGWGAQGPAYKECICGCLPFSNRCPLIPFPLVIQPIRADLAERGGNRIRSFSRCRLVILLSGPIDGFPKKRC